MVILLAMEVLVGAVHLQALLVGQELPDRAITAEMVLTPTQIVQVVVVAVRPLRGRTQHRIPEGMAGMAPQAASQDRL